VDKLGSPEIPAYLSYLLVLLCGMLVARSQVNRMLSSFPQRWGFLSTWTLFWAYAALPVVMFWFLDFTDAIHDTSLFAALLVAFGYRQIFIGGIASIKLPGQTQRLWQPFEAWVGRLLQHISAVSRRYSIRFDERVTSALASDAKSLDALMQTAFLYTTNRARLEKSLDDLNKEVAPATITADGFKLIQMRKRVAILLRDLNSSVGDDYGYFIYKRGVIQLKDYLRWFGNVRSRIIAYSVTALVLLSLSGLLYVGYKSPSLRVRYSQWRLMKANNTEMDRFRNRNYLISQLQSGNIEPVLAPILANLRYKDCSNKLADDVLRLVIDTHQSNMDRVVIPQLIEALRTENPDVRLRTNLALMDIAKASYDVSALKDDWVPKKDDSPGGIDAHVRAWQLWWANSQSSPPP
jgi:hypothetical protein